MSFTCPILTTQINLTPKQVAMAQPASVNYLPLNEAEIVVRVAGDKQAEAGGDAE